MQTQCPSNHGDTCILKSLTWHPRFHNLGSAISWSHISGMRLMFPWGISFSHRRAAGDALQNEWAAYLCPLGIWWEWRTSGIVLVLKLKEGIEYPWSVRLLISPLDFSKYSCFYTNLLIHCPHPTHTAVSLATFAIARLVVPLTKGTTQFTQSWLPSV